VGVFVVIAVAAAAAAAAAAPDTSAATTRRSRNLSPVSGGSSSDDSMAHCANVTFAFWSQLEISTTTGDWTTTIYATIESHETGENDGWDKYGTPMNSGFWMP